MAHAQQQILDAIKTLLAAGSTTAGARVFLDRVDALQASELPAILIEEDGDGESSEPYTVHGIERRTLAVQVSGVIAHATTAAADARALGLAIEKLISPSASIASLCKGGWQITSSRMVTDGDGERLLATRQQSWRFVYLVSRDSPDIIF